MKKSKLQNIWFSAIFLLLISLYSSNIICAQNIRNGIPEIHNFKRTEYNGSPQNWDIAQNSIGYLYFANNKGLLEFDGVLWTLLNIPNSESVRSVAIDKNDQIFVGGFKEFGFFKRNKVGKYQYQSISNLVSKSNKETDFIWKIHLYNNTVIFQSFSKLYLYKDGVISIFKAPNKFQFSFLIDNKLYIQDTDLGLVEFKNNSFTKILNSEIFNSTEIWGITQLNAQQLLFATLDKGLWIYDGNIFMPWNTAVNALVKQSSCLGVSIVGGNRLAFNTVLDGIVITNFEGKIIQNITRKNGLQNNTILHCFVDKRQNLWLGLDNGISFVNSESPFSYFGIDYNLTTVYGSVLHQKKLYVATNQGLFVKPFENLSDDKKFQLVAGTTGQVWSLKSIDNQLFCGHNRGVMLINNNAIQTNLQQKGTWNFKTNESKNMMITSNYTGFSLFQKSNSKWTFICDIADYQGSINNFEVRHNSIWFINNNNVHRLHLSADHKTVTNSELYNNIDNNGVSFSNLFLINNDIYANAKNVFYKYSLASNSFKISQLYSNLFKNIANVTNCQQDLFGNLWYVAGGGIGAIQQLKNRNFKNYNKQFNILEGNFVNNYEKVTVVDNKNIFIGINDGLVHFDLDNLNNVSNKPLVFIKNMSFGASNLSFSKPNMLLKSSVKYSSNSIKFTFSAPNFESLYKTNFSYKLIDFDKKWSVWSKNYFKEYTNLREGKYIMMVRTKNGFSEISDTASCDFIVSPPWYRSLFSYITYFLLFCACIYYLQISVTNKIRKNKYLETIEQRRRYSEKEFAILQEQLELEKEIERLNREKLQSEILLKDKELVNNSLQSVKKNKILNGILDGLKEIDTEKLDDATKSKFSKLNKNISKEVNDDKSWKNLEHHIKNVHHDFLKRLKEKYPKISPREMDLSTYLMLNMSTKEIAEALNISTAGVELARYRLRKKLNLVNKENLTGFLMTI